MSSKGQGTGRTSKQTQTFSIFPDGDKVYGNTSTPRHYIEPTHSAPQIGSHSGSPKETTSSLSQLWGVGQLELLFHLCGNFTLRKQRHLQNLAAHGKHLGTLLTCWCLGPTHASPGLFGQGHVNMRILKVAQVTMMDNQ